jgi:hypothetical protein
VAEADWLDELALEPGPPFLSMGVHALDLDRWLIVDDSRATDLALKHSLLEERHDEVFAALPGTDAASAEVLALVESWLTAHDLSADTDRALHPLDAAGRLVQEDLVLLDGPDHRVVAASLCFPSYWRLHDKLGKPLIEVHGPVAHYADELGEKVDRFLDRLTPERPVWRRNWSVHDDPSYFLPGPTPPQLVDGRDAAWRLWLRSERQTLRRLPASGLILFTIRTQQVMLSALALRPDVAGRLAAAIRAWSPELAAYKGGHSGAEGLLTWLDRVAG